MSIVRLIVAWLVMAALPLEGMAAASMLFCGQGGGGQPQAGSLHVHQRGVQRDHDHASHRHQDASHEAADHGQHRHASAPDDGDSGASWHGQASADGGHACPSCAACCNAVALMPEVTFQVASNAPTAHAAHPLARILTRVPARPDKPPRA